MEYGRRIAFDYGSVRIGVAASDPTGLIASPIATISSQAPDLVEQIVNLCLEYEPIYIVVGEPKHLSGNSSATGSDVAQFVEILKSITNVPIHLIDERMSTVNAAKTLREAGLDAKSSKTKIDAMAAVVILESALARERIAGGL